MNSNENNTKRDKLKQLLGNWPDGAVFLAAELSKRDVFANNLQVYRKNGWVRMIADGVYIKMNDEPSWAGALWALQTQTQSKIYVGGKSSLDFQGYGQNVSLKPHTITLYTPKQENLPKWFSAPEWNMQWKLFRTTLFPVGYDFGIDQRDIQGFEVKYSCPERAALEMLNSVPQLYSFEHASNVMETLLQMRADFILNLLKECKSVKTKRLFLFFSTWHSLPFLQNFDLKSVDIGKGPRQLAQNGVLDKQWQIIVPHEFAKKNQEP